MRIRLNLARTYFSEYLTALLQRSHPGAEVVVDVLISPVEPKSRPTHRKTFWKKIDEKSSEQELKFKNEKSKGGRCNIF